MKYISTEGVELLKLAKMGDSRAETDLIMLIKSEFMIRRIYRYLSKNRAVDNEDIKQEFLIGAALAISQAKLDVGDPFEYLLQRGLWRVKSYMRKHILQSTFQVCKECGNVSRLNRFESGYICKKCGATHIETYEVNDHDDTVFDVLTTGDQFEDEVISEMIVTKFRSTLTPGTNVYSLFELLIDRGINRDNPHIKNYTKTIAEIWGGCSQNNVVQTLNKLKDKFQKFIDQIDGEVG